MIIFASLLFIIIFVLKYTQKYSSVGCCPYCKSNHIHRETDFRSTPFRMAYHFLNISTYCCKSCLNYFHQNKSRVKPYLNYDKIVIKQSHNRNKKTLDKQLIQLIEKGKQLPFTINPKLDANVSNLMSNVCQANTNFQSNF